MTLISKLHEYAKAGLSNRFWYEESHASASAFCQDHDIPVSEFLAVVAILSPRVQVSRNVSLAKQYVLSGDTSGIMSQRVRALEVWKSTGIISGAKVNAFYKSLMLDDHAVCIDSHMSRLFGYDGRLMEKTKHWVGRREKAQRVVGRLARQWGVKPRQMQAMLWCGYLKSEASRNSGFGSMEF